MGVASIGGQDFTILAAVNAAQAPDPRLRSTETQPVGAALVARSGPRPKEEQVQQDAADAAIMESPRRAGTRMYVDKASRQIVAQIVDENNEVITQIPPEEQLKLVAKFQEVTGKIFDETV